MELEYQITLNQTGLTMAQLPLDLKGAINNFKKTQNETDKNDAAQVRYLESFDASIADRIQTYYEEINNLTDNPMLENDDLKRAQAVGLDENATIEQVEALEKQALDKAEADKTAADSKAKEEADKAAADAKAKEEADKLSGDAKSKEEADKAAADAKAKADEAAKKKTEEDDDDTFTFLGL
jgi:membrane protein involved in colicin uptake